MSEEFYVCSSKDYPQIAKCLQDLENLKKEQAEKLEFIKQQMKVTEERKNKAWKEIEREIEEKGLLKNPSKYQMTFNSHGQIFASEYESGNPLKDFLDGVLR